MTGFASVGRCHPSADLAAAHLCGSAFPVVESSGGSIVVTSCEASSAAYLTLSRTVDGASALGVTVTASYPACDELEWLSYNPFGLSLADGLLVSGAIALVWSMAWAWRAVFSTVRGQED